jgi:hypothetical protein
MKIISDGTYDGTQVLDDSGNVMKNVTEIVINPITAAPPRRVTATLKVLKVELELKADVKRVKVKRVDLTKSKGGKGA